MDVNVKHPWHEQLHQLDGLPLVACRGDKRPYQEEWQTKSLTPQQIIDEDCAAVGLRCGTDSKIVGVDLDGNTAQRLAIDAKCEPYEHNTWIRERPNAVDRTMVFFTVPEVYWSLLPTKKIVHITKQGAKGEQEQVEIFWGNTSQVIALGKHPSGVFYDWVGTSPADLKPLPPEWLAFWLKLAAEQDDTSTAVVKQDRQPNSGGWSYVDDCDVCGRDGRKKPDCRQNHNGEVLLCKHGNSYTPPKGLKKDQVIQGATKQWRFNAIVTNEVGTFSRFILEALPTMPKQSQGAIRQKGRRIIEPDEALLLLPDRLGGISMNIRSQKIVAGTRGELSGDQVQRIYTRLCTSDEKWLKEATADCLFELAMENQVDPVLAWLESITAEPLCDSDWNNLDQFLLGTKDAIARAYFKRFLVAAVARVYEPGCKVRQTPVLHGGQDLGKTELGSAIFGEQWFGSDGLSPQLNHDDVAKVIRFWCFELGELDGYRGQSVAKMKNFLTQRTDYTRFVYKNSHQELARRSVFWGTSNGIPLNDPTGSSRFVVIPIETETPHKDVALAREPLWARALLEYRNGARYWSTADEMAAILERNGDHQTVEPWYDAIRYHAENIVKDSRLPVTTEGLYNAVGITEVKDRNQHNAERIRNVMKALGFYHQTQKRVGDKRLTGYWPSTGSTRKW